MLEVQVCCLLFIYLFIESSFRFQSCGVGRGGWQVEEVAVFVLGLNRYRRCIVRFFILCVGGFWGFRGFFLFFVYQGFRFWFLFRQVSWFLSFSGNFFRYDSRRGMIFSVLVFFSIVSFQLQALIVFSRISFCYWGGDICQLEFSGVFYREGCIVKYLLVIAGIFFWVYYLVV